MRKHISYYLWILSLHSSKKTKSTEKQLEIINKFNKVIIYKNAENLYKTSCSLINYLRVGFLGNPALDRQLVVRQLSFDLDLEINFILCSVKN